MTTPDTSPTSTPGAGSRRVRANGDGTVYQRKDGRWEAAGYVLTAGDTRKRIRVYGTTRKDAPAQLTEKIATSNRGIPTPNAQGSLAAFLTYWLETVAVTGSGRTLTPATQPSSGYTSSRAWARRSSPSSPPRTSAPGSTNSAPPANAAHAASTPPATSRSAAQSGHAAAGGCPR